MKIGILDTKVNGQQIDNVELYRQRGYEIINSKHIDDGKHFDIVASTWTRLNEKRIKLAKIKGIVIKDNDEPGNVVDVSLLERLKIPYGLIGLWGISTRVAWNMNKIAIYKPEAEWKNLDVLMIANTPSHDALKGELMRLQANVTYPVTPANTDHGEVAKMVSKADVVIVHLGLDDYHRYWLDPALPYFRKNSLMISTTRGPIYSAQELNRAVEQRKITAVLDWAWEEDKLIRSEKIIHTGHTSYRSEQSGTELAQEVIKAVEKMRKKLSR
jgi:hypothetical protein